MSRTLGLARRACAAAGALAVGVGVLMFTGGTAYAAGGPNKAAPAAPGTIDCVSDIGTYRKDCKQLTPTLSCVWDNGDGTYSAALGYENESGYTIESDAGSYQNAIYINGNDKDMGQPSVFPAGASETAFVIDWTPMSGDWVQWQLDGNDLGFSSKSAPACAQHPVPIMGSAMVWGIGGGVAVCALLLWNRRSMRRKEWIRRLSQAA